jgi:hypothetical protein
MFDADARCRSKLLRRSALRWLSFSGDRTWLVTAETASLDLIAAQSSELCASRLQFNKLYYSKNRSERAVSFGESSRGGPRQESVLLSCSSHLLGRRGGCRFRRRHHFGLRKSALH